MKKDAKILELFFNEPTKHWHFEEILKKAKISRPQAAQWLKKFQKENLVQRIKKRDKMPYFQAYFEHPNYRTKKRIFALAALQNSGLLKHLMSLSKAKTVIVFGSFSRADWYSDSDIDLFIYGSDDELETEQFRKALKHDIQVFVAKDRNDLEKFGSGLLRNILEGILIKGKIDFVEVIPLATV